MRNCDGNDQRDRETRTLFPNHEEKVSLEQFWRDQLNRLKEYAELQAIKTGSRGD